MHFANLDLSGLCGAVGNRQKEFCFYSLAMDENIDCCDTAQLINN